MAEMNDRSLYLMDRNLTHVERLLKTDTDIYDPLLLQIDIMIEVLGEWLSDTPNIGNVDRAKLEAIAQRIEDLETLLESKLVNRK